LDGKDPKSIISDPDPDPGNHQITDPDPQSQIISDPTGSRSGTMEKAKLFHRLNIQNLGHNWQAK